MWEGKIGDTLAFWSYGVNHMPMTLLRPITRLQFSMKDLNMHRVNGKIHEGVRVEALR
jgi:hypothetical protein